jgi:hypothetical protein
MEPMIVVPPDGVYLAPGEDWFPEESPDAIGGFVLVTRRPTAIASYAFDVAPGETYYIWLTWIGGTDRVEQIRIDVSESDVLAPEKPLIIHARQRHYNGYPALAHGVPDRTGRRWFCAYSFTVIRSRSLIVLINTPAGAGPGLFEAPTVQVVNSRVS